MAVCDMLSKRRVVAFHDAVLIAQVLAHTLRSTVVNGPSRSTPRPTVRSAKVIFGSTTEN